VWILDVARPAVVLGSTQLGSAVDAARAESAGIDVVRRRSGGGAVLVEPGALVWIDVLAPAGDPLWEPDIGRAFAWLGQAWAGALADVGVPGAEVHNGPLQATPWSATVCFAALGPGEVTVGGAKVVGMCQRRVRAGALFQCAALLSWGPDLLLDVLALTADDRRRGCDELGSVAQGLDVGPAELAEALVARLP